MAGVAWAMLLTAPQVARLCARPRFWATRAIKRGDFGPVHESPGRVLKVEIAYVEEALGVRFSDERMAAARRAGAL
jgi:hypothetical protein